jgi:hypothetical protein
MENDFLEESIMRDLRNVRAIDAEIASLAASLGPDIKRAGLTPTPNELEMAIPRPNPPIEQPPSSSLKRVLAFLSLGTSLMVSATPYLVTGGTCNTLIDVLT